MTFEEYVLVRGTALVRLARLLTGDEHQGQDLAQEVLVKAFLRWRRIAALDRPDLYVRRMLVNAHRSWRRRPSTKREVSAASVSLPDVSPDAVADIAERDTVWRLVLSLPARQRAVIVLRYYEDYDDATIADLLGCGQGSVRTHAKRALAKLHQAVDPQSSVTDGKKQ